MKLAKTIVGLLQYFIHNGLMVLNTVCKYELTLLTNPGVSDDAEPPNSRLWLTNSADGNCNGVLQIVCHQPMLHTPN